MVRGVTKGLINKNNAIKTLSDEGEIICVASHSIFKEQILTLADILDFMYRANSKYLDPNTVVSIAKSCGVDIALEFALSLSLRVLSKAGLKRYYKNLRKIHKMLSFSSFIEDYADRISSNEPPYKFSIIDIIIPLTKLLRKSDKARISLLNQICQLFKLKSYHSRMIGPILLSRLRRRTY